MSYLRTAYAWAILVTVLSLPEMAIFTSRSGPPFALSGDKVGSVLLLSVLYFTLDLLL